MIHRLAKGDVKTPIREFLGAKWTTLVRLQKGHDKIHSPLGVWVGVDHPLQLPVGWCKYVTFQFALINEDEEKSVESPRRGITCVHMNFSYVMD